MSGLRYPIAARVVGGVAGALAFVAARVLAWLPDGAIAQLAGVGARLLRGSAEGRALADVRDAFAAGGGDARVCRRVIRESRREEIAGVVRTAVIGMLT